MKLILLVIQLILAIILSIVILIQSRGTGFARSTQTSSFTRRGVEQLVFRSTFVISALFLLVSILSLLS